MSDADFKWHIWVIRQNRFEKVTEILEELSEVDRFVYPTRVTEYRTSRGVKKRRTPLYSGYLFIRYRDHPHVFHKLNAHPFFTTYVGTCTGADLEKVEEVERLEDWNVINKSVFVDDIIKVNSGSFKGFTGKVVETTPAELSCFLNILGRSVKTRLSKDDVDVIGREE